MSSRTGAKERPPRVLWSVLFLQVWLMTLWLESLFGLLRLGGGGFRLPPGVLLQFGLTFGWHCVVLAICIPLLLGRRWAWSVLMAVIYVRLAGSVANLVWLAMALLPARGRTAPPLQAILLMLPSTLFTAALVGTACFALFRSAPWFGVEHRRVWRTTFREAWWAWGVCAVLGVGLPLLIQLGRGF